MKIKKIILTQKQLDEICGDNSTYLDSLALKPDSKSNYSNEITTSGPIETGYPKPITTDDFASDTTNNNRGYWRLRGMGNASTIRECSKKEWEKEIFNETNQHLTGRTFGATSETPGKSYAAVTTNKSRLNSAIKQSRSNNPQIKRKALNTIKKMQDNGSTSQLAFNQSETAKKTDKQIHPNIKSAPKNNGNGKAHTTKITKNGTFINE